jgi:hypothetical protein
MRQRLSTSQLSVFLAAVLTLALAPGSIAQETEAAATPVLSIDEVIVEPGNPGADTLCKLRVKLGNKGSETASQLAFKVTLNGQDLGVYGNQLFMFPVEPGADNELKLYNFWTTETSRSMPKDGKLEVEVTLTEARWMKIADDEEGVEVWSPLGDVEGLPVSKSVTLEMKK